MISGSETQEFLFNVEAPELASLSLVLQPQDEVIEGFNKCTISSGSVYLITDRDQS